MSLAPGFACTSLARPLLAHVHTVPFTPFTMSDAENDNSVLGKRARNGQDAEEEPEANESVKVDVAEDESDDDVGPMPMPAGAGNGAVKKKRKGTWLCFGAPLHF